LKNNILLFAVSTIILLTFPKTNYAQAPNLGTTVNFVLFSTNGAVTNTGSSNLTGNVGTNNGSSTGFGNVNGSIHDGDAVSAQCASDLLTAYNQLNSAVPTAYPGTLLGIGQTLTAGVYSIGSAATLNGTLTLDAQNNANAVFIFKVQGSFSTTAASKVQLLNGALACNVFWKIEGLVSMATNSVMRGTIIANNAAITMNTGDTLEGRALSTTGAVTVHGVHGYTPTGCGSVVLTGPVAPTLGTTACYAIFSSSGTVTNSGITHVTGDVGTNSGATTGFDTSYVIGTVHTIPDASTAQCATDLSTLYTYLNTLPNDISLLYPAQFGNNLSLTPHTYLLNGATTLTDTVFLDAQGDPSAVFVIKINGAFSTGTYSYVKLINRAQSKNVFWKIEGAVSINNYSVFRGTLVCNNGSLTSLNTGVMIDGRAFTTTGSITCNAISAVMTAGCASAAVATVITQPVNQISCLGGTVHFSTTATGAGLSYQWRNGTTNLVNSSSISGVTTNTLAIDPVSLAQASLLYNVIVSSTNGSKDTSLNTSLIVNSSPSITVMPQNQSVCAGDTASFGVGATGAGLTYQWRKGSVNIINGGATSGANSPTLIITGIAAADTGGYNVMVAGVCSPEVTSQSALLTMCGTYPSGINAINENGGISIYPNPFTTNLNYTMSTAYESTELKMYNVLGVLVIDYVLTDKSGMIATNLSSGIYFYQMTGNGKIIQAGKLIAQ
jgi:hypothetical protein